MRLLVRKERSEQRKKDEEERAQKEKEAVIKVRVNEWVEEKTNWVVEMRKKEARKEQKKKDKKEKEKQEIMDRAKVLYPLLILHGGNKGPLVIALVPLKCSNRNLQFPHRVPFTKEKMPWCHYPFKNEVHVHRPETPQGL